MYPECSESIPHEVSDQVVHCFPIIRSYGHQQVVSHVHLDLFKFQDKYGKELMWPSILGKCAKYWYMFYLNIKGSKYVVFSHESDNVLLIEK